MKTIYLDFETFYDKGYTLSGSMSTSEYVRHPEFKVHMVAWAIDDGPLQWCDGELAKIKLPALGWDDATLVCHNTAFDGFILSHHYGIVPARYCDTMLLSRALHGANVKHGLADVCARLGLEGKMKGVLEGTKGVRDLPDDVLEKLAEYCCQDVDQMAQAYALLIKDMPQGELDLIDITLKMFCDPVLEVDRSRVEIELDREVGSKVAKVLKAGVSADELSSNDKFAKLLERMGVTPPMKVSLATNKQTWAFAKKDRGFLELLHNGSQNVRDVCEARLAIKSTIGETRANRFLVASANGDKLPVLLQYCGAHTTRWSAGNKMNMQNLPRDGELRKSILAPPGQVIVVIDSAQIEARVNLWLAEDHEQLDIFRNYDAGTGPDLYRVMAAQIYGIPVDQVGKEQRFIGKICVLALGYGMGAQKFKETLATNTPPFDMPLEECSRIVRIYRNHNERITGLWSYFEIEALYSMMTGEELEYKALGFSHERMHLPSGLAIHYTDLKATWNDWSRRYFDAEYDTGRGIKKLYGGLLTENAVQALSRCVIADQMRIIGERYRVVMMTHDEISFLAPEDRGEEALAWGLEIMRTPPEWAAGLPLNAEGSFARNYSK